MKRKIALGDLQFRGANFHKLAEIQFILRCDRYAVGERLEVNCSSAATLPPANLTWYINQRPVQIHCKFYNRTYGKLGLIG